MAKNGYGSRAWSSNLYPCWAAIDAEVVVELIVSPAVVVHGRAEKEKKDKSVLIREGRVI